MALQNGTSLRQAVTGGNNTAGQFQNLDNAYGVQGLSLHYTAVLLAAMLKTCRTKEGHSDGRAF